MTCEGPGKHPICDGDDRCDPYDDALFAPDYGSQVDPVLIEAALKHVSPGMANILTRFDDEGWAPTSIDGLLLRDLMLHGLSEVFETRLTPLGMAVRHGIHMDGEGR